MSSSNRRIRTEYPYLIEKHTAITIVLDDNVKLAATLWLPKSLIIFSLKSAKEFPFILQDKNEELIKEEKFATILEYLPYRKADWT